MSQVQEINIAAEADAEKRRLETLAFACGPRIMDFVNDDSVIEIAVNNDGSLWIQRYGEPWSKQGYLHENPVFCRHASVAIVKYVANSMGKTVTNDTPKISGIFPIDGSRFEGMIAPSSTPCATITIRKKAKKIFTLPEYLEQGVIDEKCISIIEKSIVSKKNIVVVGGTSSGKTTFCNGVLDALAKLCPHDRILILEDVPELQCKAENTVQLRTHENEFAKIDLNELAKSAMRLSPDRIIVGEVRDKAALELLKLWNTGHPGGIGTYHADSALEAIPRMCELVNEARAGDKKPLIGRAVDIVLFMRKTADNKRILSEILEVKGFDENTNNFLTETLYERAA